MAPDASTGTPARTLTVTDASTEPPDAVIVAAPIPTAVTRPPPLTVAMVGSLDFHASVALATTAPVELMGVAVNCTVVPVSIGALGAPLTTSEAMLDGAVAPPSDPTQDALDTMANIRLPRHKPERRGMIGGAVKNKNAAVLQTNRAA